MIGGGGVLEKVEGKESPYANSGNPNDGNFSHLLNKLYRAKQGGEANEGRDLFRAPRGIVKLFFRLRLAQRHKLASGSGSDFPLEKLF
jgi:hypothetical protein